MSLPDSRSAEPPRGVVVQKPRSNVYTVLLGIALVALIIGCICLYGELNLYKWDFKAAGAR